MSKLAQKVVTAGVAIVTIASLSAPVFAQVDASALAAQIAALQQQLAALQGQVSTPASYSFSKNLTLGSKGADVTALQNILISGGYLKISAPTAYFGPATKAAVIAWQKAAGISPASGYVGALSRAKLNSGSTTSSTGGTVVTATDAYLKVEGVPSLGGTIPSSSLYNKVLNLKLTAGKDGVIVTGVTATRGGYIANTRINGVSVWDETGKRYGNIVTSLTSDGKVTVSFSSDPLIVPAGTTKNLSVAINLTSDTGSASVNFAIVSKDDVKVSGTTPVTGSFPIVGGTYQVVDGSASLGDIRVTYDPVSGMSSSSAQNSSVAGNLEIGDSQREVFKLKLTQNNSKEAVALKYVTLYVGGNIVESTDLANWKLYSQEGNELATASASKDRFVTFNLATPYIIDKGLTRTFTVKADVKDGSGRYFQVFIQNDYDIVATGVTTGSSVLLTDVSGGSLTQSDTQDNTAGWFKMKSGALTVSKSTSSPSGSIAPSASNAVLASFDIKSSGEQLELRKMALRVIRSGAAPVLNGSITVKDAVTGETYYSVSADTTGLQGTSTPSSWSSSDQQSLSSYITLTSNQTRTVQVLGTVSSAATSGSYQVVIGDFYAKRFSTNDYQDIATSVYSANQLTLQDVTLSVTKNSSFASTNRAAGATNVKVGEFNLQASAADDIQVNTISLKISTSSNFQNVALYDGTTQLGSTIGTPSDTGNSFTVNLTVPKSGTKTVSVYANIMSGATTNSVVSIAAAGVSGYGKVSGKALSSTPASDTPGQTIAIGSPSITIAADNNPAIVSRIVLAGQTGVSLGDLKFSAQNEDLTLRKVTFALQSASTSLWSNANLAANFTAIHLFDGAIELGSTTNLSGGNVVISLTADKYVTLPGGSDKILTVKADVSPDSAILPQSVFNIGITSSSTTDLEINSASLGIMSTGVTLSSAVTSYYKVQASAPVVAAASYTANTVGAPNSEIARFTVSKQGTRNTGLTGITVRVQNNGGSASTTVGTFELYEVVGGSLSSTALATSAASLSGAATSTNVQFTFATTTISSNRTFAVVANTSGIETGVTNAGQNTANIFVDFVGSVGYSASTSNLWSTGNIAYGYDVFNPSLTTYAGLTSIDTATVRLGTNTY